MNAKKINIDVIIRIVFGAIIFSFFAIFFPHHFHYREQFQMFLFTSDYLCEVCLKPGGLSDYAGRFLTQFYVSSLTGSLIFTLIIVMIREGVYNIVRKLCKERSAEWLSYLPALAYTFLLCDETTQTGGPIALCISLYIAIITVKIKRNTARLIAYPFIIISGYMLIGGIISLSVALILIYERKNTVVKRDFAITAATCIALAAVTPFAAKIIWEQYPIERLWRGVDYSHFVNYNPWDILYICTFILIIVLISPRLSVYQRKISLKSSRITGILSVAIALYAAVTLGWRRNSSKEELMSYDYHCRNGNWTAIIDKAKRKSPATPMTVCCLNLALYKSGRLTDDMFNYYQNGPDGLLPSFRRDFMIPTVGGEAYYHLGFINTAQRFAFEAMEALPDFQKSVRSIKRLAETNIIAGHYERADKYLYFLEHTIFYRKWAEDARRYLYNDSLVEAHHEWSNLRRFQTKEDYLFNEREKDMILGICFTQNPDNRMAYEYLIAYALLVKDMKNFRRYYELPKSFATNAIPKACQEALIYIWGLSGASPDNIPLPVSNDVKKAVKSYANIYTTIAAPEPILRKDFAKTYWYYLHFREYNRANHEQTYQY